MFPFSHRFWHCCRNSESRPVSCVILITHDMAVISEIADRVVVLKDGRIVEMGSPAAVLGNPSQTYTKRLVSSVPPTDRRIDRFHHEFRSGQRGRPKSENPQPLATAEKHGRIMVRVKSLSKSFSDESFMRIAAKEPVHAVRDVSLRSERASSWTGW